MVITNTFFKLPKRRLWTWRSPADTKDNIVRNQIDYILVNDRFKNSVKSVKTYPGADVNSVSSLKVTLKRIIKHKNKPTINIRQLKNPDIFRDGQLRVNCNLKSITSCQSASTVDETWTKIKNAMVPVAEKNLMVTKREKQSWMTDDILELMDKRRQSKNDPTKYKEINSKIKTQIKEAKENWIRKECEEIKDYERKYVFSFNLHKKIKEITGKKKQTSFSYKE